MRSQLISLIITSYCFKTTAGTVGVRISFIFDELMKRYVVWFPWTNRRYVCLCRFLCFDFEAIYYWSWILLDVVFIFHIHWLWKYYYNTTACTIMPMVGLSAFIFVKLHTGTMVWHYYCSASTCCCMCTWLAIYYKIWIYYLCSFVVIKVTISPDLSWELLKWRYSIFGALLNLFVGLADKMMSRWCRIRWPMP